MDFQLGQNFCFYRSKLNALQYFCTSGLTHLNLRKSQRASIEVLTLFIMCNSGHLQDIVCYGAP